MKNGSPVWFVDGDGDAHASIVTAVVGSSASGAKLLNVKTPTTEWYGVRHERDAVEGEAHWRLNEPPARLREEPRAKNTSKRRKRK